MWAAVKGDEEPWKAGPKWLAQMISRAAGVGFSFSCWAKNDLLLCLADNKAFADIYLVKSVAATSLLCAPKGCFL